MHIFINQWACLLKGSEVIQDCYQQLYQWMKNDKIFSLMELKFMRRISSFEDKNKSYKQAFKDIYIESILKCNFLTCLHVAYSAQLVSTSVPFGLTLSGLHPKAIIATEAIITRERFFKFFITF